MNISPILFEYRHVSNENHKHIRGIQALSTILSNRINSISTISGHVLIVYNEKSFIVLDGVPKMNQLHYDDIEGLVQFVNGKGGKRHGNVLAGKCGGNVLAAVFDVGSPLRLIVIDDTGCVSYYIWMPKEVRWREQYLSLSFTDRSPLLACYHANSFDVRGVYRYFIYWFHPIDNGYGFYRKEFSQSSFKEEEELFKSDNMPIDIVTLGDGLLIYLENKDVLYWSISMYKLVEVENSHLYAEKERTFFHNITRDFLHVSETGQVSVLQTSDDKIYFRPLSQLEDYDECDSFDSLNQYIISYSKNSALAKVNDIKNGNFITPMDMPGRILSTNIVKSCSSGTINGVFYKNRIYQIIQHSISSIANHISNSRPDSTKWAALLCKQWDMDDWSAKYLLDIIYEWRALHESYSLEPSIDDDPNIDFQAKKQEIIDSCSNIIPFLQNPSLIVSILLSTGIFPKFLFDKVTELVSTLSKSVKKKNLKNSFQYHTVLNISVLPELNALTHDSPGENIIKVPELEMYLEMPPQQFLENCKNILLFDELVSKYPEQVFEKLEESLNISAHSAMLSGGKKIPENYSFDINSSLLHVQIKGDSINYFETMIKLYYELCPSKLIPFVDLIKYASVREQIQYKIFYKKALDVLPIKLELDEEMFQHKLDARVYLLDGNGAAQKALNMLLGLSADDPVYWTRLLEYMEKKLISSRENYSAEYNELFITLISYCLKHYKEEDEKILDVWKLKPESFTFSIFLNLLNAEFLEKGGSKNTVMNNGPETIPIGIFKQLMLELIK